MKLVSATSETPVFKDGFVELVDGIEVLIPEGAKPGDTWEIEIIPFTSEAKLTSATLGDSSYITNYQTLVSEVRGNLVQTHRDTKETEGWDDLPSKSTFNLRTDKLAVHYNHLFTAKGRTLFWSDLDYIWNWYPRPQNEADFRTIEWENEDITAIAEVNDILFIHFPTAVYTCNYIGKPAVVNINQRNEGHGAVTQESLIIHKNSQFYMGVDNFYQWSPLEGIIPIGEEIWKRIGKVDITKVFGYVDRVNKEIHWVIGDYIWAFNYIERHWSKYSSNHIQDHITVPESTSLSFEQTVAESGSNIKPDQMKGLYNLMCKEDGLYRDFQAGGDINKVCMREVPYLVSDEQTYGDIFNEKDTDLVVLDGRYGVGLDGFNVQVSAKDYVSDDDNFKTLGIWRHERKFQQADGKKVSGRSLKFKFELRDKVAVWDGRYIAEGHTLVSGMNIHVWNGWYKMDGKHRLVNLNEGLWDGGTTYIKSYQSLDIGTGLLYAWGERVMLPKQNVGEDK